MNESSRFRPERSGIYLAPHGPAALREAAQRAGCAWFEVKVSAARDKTGFLAAAARDLGFPLHFGDNWDAFADCIGDLRAAGSGAVIAFEGAESFSRHAPDEWATALEILRDSASQWRARERTFVVLVDFAAPVAALKNFP